MSQLLALFLIFWGAALSAATCETVEFEEQPFVVCTVDMASDDLRLFLNDDSGSSYSYFGVLDNALQENGQRLAFATNGGMYHEDRSPVGHYVEDGTELRRVIESAGPGNFGLLPNGIFCLRDGRADVFETIRFQRERPDCRSATQSGPMLVIDGALHPRFLPDSDSRFIRNGVGTSADGQTAYFAISDTIVTFHTFGRLFRDLLKTPNALFLDGNISRLRAPELGRSGTGFTPLGPIIGVVVPAE